MSLTSYQTAPPRDLERADYPRSVRKRNLRFHLAKRTNHLPPNASEATYTPARSRADSSVAQWQSGRQLTGAGEIAPFFPTSSDALFPHERTLCAASHVPSRAPNSYEQYRIQYQTGEISRVDDPAPNGVLHTLWSLVSFTIFEAALESWLSKSVLFGLNPQCRFRILPKVNACSRRDPTCFDLP